MKKQTTTVTAKNQQEFDSRISDLVERGYTVDQIHNVKENEYRHYSYLSDNRSVRKKHRETDVQQKFSASLSRMVEK